MSNKFEMIKLFYDNGAWNVERVASAVVKGWITASEYEEIVGEAYQGA